MKPHLSIMPSSVVACSTMVLALTLLGVTHVSSATEPSAPLDLNGRVERDNGQPITNAHVFVYTAGPRVGASPI